MLQSRMCSFPVVVPQWSCSTAGPAGFTSFLGGAWGGNVWVIATQMVADVHHLSILMRVNDLLKR